MSTQNLVTTEVLASETINHDINIVNIEQLINEKTQEIRRINLLIGFKEASLAVLLEKKRKFATVLFNREEVVIRDKQVILHDLKQMQQMDNEISGLLNNIQALLITLKNEENSLKGAIAK